MKNKCQLFLPSFSSWRKNYNQHTTSVWLETNKCSEYIEKRIYQVSVFDPTITTIIHEIITENDQKKNQSKKKTKNVHCYIKWLQERWKIDSENI